MRGRRRAVADLILWEAAEGESWLGEEMRAGLAR